ncbi:hypothetical protein TNCV_1436811 [Trichonephila clavipes]|nr:hypothetical protein TNCV_1436811 [Trichonephila clavipes]
MGLKPNGCSAPRVRLHEKDNGYPLKLAKQKCWSGETRSVVADRMTGRGEFTVNTFRVLSGRVAWLPDPCYVTQHTPI